MLRNATWISLFICFACAPRPAVVPGECRASTPPEAASERSGPAKPGTTGASTEASAATADDPEAPCGLPEEIREPSWPRVLAPTTAQEPIPFVPRSTTLAVLPDTQYYAFCRYGHLSAQSEWLASNAAARNIAAAVQLGDITETNGPEEWAFVKDAFSPLYPVMPLLLTTGNHDHGKEGKAGVRSSYFQQYFPAPAAATQAVLVETMGAGNLENAYYRIPVGRVHIGILMLEWSPRTSTVKWANDVVGRHPKDRVALVTHAYLYSDDTRYDAATRGVAQRWNPRGYDTARLPHAAETDHTPHPEGAYDGEMLWRDLVSQHAGFFLTLNGHVLGDGTGLLSSRGVHGNLVHQVLVNYQMLNEGGLGYLRLLEFLPDGHTLRMKTFSPSLGVFATADDQNFDLEVVPPLW